jgi:multicomponent Na+:H+ antiporter subunit B
MIGQYAGQVVRVVSVLMAPPVILFGLYVITHGHYGPGGGFSGGVVVGVGVILLRITVDRDLCRRYLPPALGPGGACVGVLVFLVTGALPLLGGGAYLDYAYLDDAARSAGAVPSDLLRYLGIFVVKLGVGMAVAGTMLMLFDTLAGSADHDPGSEHDTGTATDTGRAQPDGAPAEEVTGGHR